jgi:hypothetical protein
MSSKPLPEPEETLNRFAIGLAKQVAADGWIVSREMDSRSHRGFVLEKNGREIHFFCKLSQTERGFWGLSKDKAKELAASSSEHLILLTGAFEGYFIAAGRLSRLIPTLSRVDKDGGYRINENRIAKESRFVTLVRLWQYLQRRI